MEGICSANVGLIRGRHDNFFGWLVVARTSCPAWHRFVILGLQKKGDETMLFRVRIGLVGLRRVQECIVGYVSVKPRAMLLSTLFLACYLWRATRSRSRRRASGFAIAHVSTTLAGVIATMSTQAVYNHCAHFQNISLQYLN